MNACELTGRSVCRSWANRSSKEGGKEMSVEGNKLIITRTKEKELSLEKDNRRRETRDKKLYIQENSKHKTG